MRCFWAISPQLPYLLRVHQIATMLFICFRCFGAGDPIQTTMAILDVWAGQSPFRPGSGHFITVPYRIRSASYGAITVFHKCSFRCGGYIYGKYAIYKNGDITCVKYWTDRARKCEKSHEATLSA